MDEEQRDGTLDGTSLMHIMHVQLAESVHRDDAREHGERVQFALVRAPVVTILPLAGEPLDVGERYAVVPFGSVDLVRQAGILELAIEQRELIIWDGYFERLLLGGHVDEKIRQRGG